MEQLFNDFIQNATTFQKGVFIMIAGVCFVFAVQVIFYLIVKLWPKNQAAEK
jgi:Na+-transporting methylmalonyl-CoA/oxaloacetate decarboxylase gamma subunit